MRERERKIILYSQRHEVLNNGITFNINSCAQGISNWLQKQGHVIISFDYNISFLQLLLFS